MGQDLLEVGVGREPIERLGLRSLPHRDVQGRLAFLDPQDLRDPIQPARGHPATPLTGVIHHVDLPRFLELSLSIEQQSIIQKRHIEHQTVPSNESVERLQSVSHAYDQSLVDGERISRTWMVEQIDYLGFLSEFLDSTTQQEPLIGS